MARGGFFVLRQHGNVQGELLGQRRSKGRCETGWVYEQRLRLRGEERQVIEVRRITVVLDKPTRDGDTEIHILTNLPARKVPAVRVAEIYRKRWTIEGLFFEVAQTLSCEIDTLCYPKAALFAFCLGLLACNAVALLKAALRAVHGEEVVSGQLSAYYLVLEIRQTYAGMMVALPPARWSVFEEFGDAQLARVLREIASQVVIRRYRKTPRGPKKPPPQRSATRMASTSPRQGLLPSGKIGDVGRAGPQAVFDRDGSVLDGPPRAEAEGVRFKDRFPFRFQGQFDQTLHDPVFQGRHIPSALPLRPNSLRDS